MKPGVIQKLQILRAESVHSSLLPECLALVERTQGKGIFEPDYFCRCASGEDDRLLLIALLDGKLAGVATARVLPETILITISPLEKKPLSSYSNSIEWDRWKPRL
jgi:hypothetical protein